MPKKCSFDVKEYYDGFNNTYRCKMCHKKFKSTKNYNLKTHLEKMHNVVFDEKSRTKIILQKYKKKKIKCDISKKLLIKSYIGLVTDEDVSFSALNSDHMRNIIDPICRGIEKESGEKFCLNADNCKTALAEVARNIGQAIYSECERKIVALKVDSATISAQFVKNDQIVSRTLGMIESKGVYSSSAIDLASEILNVLSKYNINIQQVVSITTDNGSNCLKSFNILPGVFAEEEDEDKEVKYNCDNETYFQNIELIEKKSVLLEGDITITTCAAQVAQLVALETSKNVEIKKYIRNCRNFVKFLRRNPHDFRDLFKQKSLEIPQLDCPTRWGSTYSMIYDIKNAKDAGIVDSVESVTNKSSEENFEVNEDLWNFVEAYCLALRPLNKAIVYYQEQQLHYGDFYAKWLQCTLITQKNIDENTFNNNSLLYTINCVVLEIMEKRSKTLFSNHALAACLYLDPRFHHLLVHTRKNEAIEYLKDLWIKLTKVNTTGVSSPITNKIVIKAEIGDGEGEEADILGAFLDKEFYANTTKKEDDVSTKIERLKIPYLKNISNILEFWKERKYTDPELYALSNVCFGIPATQVSADLRLSHLKRLISDNSDGVKCDTLENLLLVKCNPDFLARAITDIDTFFTQDDYKDEFLKL